MPSEQPKDGGPAFPNVHGKVDGLTLRDYFAAAALTGLLYCSEDGSGSDVLAKASFAYADAMLLERNK